MDTIEKLRDPNSGSGKLGSIMLISAGGSAVLAQFLRPFIDFSIETTVVVNLMLLMLGTLIIIISRLYMRRSLDKRLHQVVNIEECEAITINIRPKHFKQYIIPIISYFFFLSTFYLMGLAFLETSIFALLLVYLVSLIFF